MNRKGKKHKQSKLLKTQTQYKKIYDSFGIVNCPALSNAEVRFNRFGWDHLCRRKWRTKPEMLERMELLPYAKKLIATTTTIQTIRIYNGFKTFEFNAIMDGRRITAIVSRTKNGFIFVSNFKDDNNNSESGSM